MTACWLAPFDSTPCEGSMQRAHLIREQTIRREVSRKHSRDPRVLVLACRHHHARLDWSRKLKVPRDALPRAVEEFAAEHGIDWWLDREYGMREEAA